MVLILSKQIIIAFSGEIAAHYHIALSDQSNLLTAAQFVSRVGKQLKCRSGCIIFVCFHTDNPKIWYNKCPAKLQYLNDKFDNLVPSIKPNARNVGVIFDSNLTFDN